MHPENHAQIKSAEELFSLGPIEYSKYRALKNSKGLPHEAPPKGSLIGKYSYLDENGEVLYRIIRYAPKRFEKRRRGSLKGIKRVPYCLPDILKSDFWDPVFLCDNEKDADCLRRLGGCLRRLGGCATIFRDWRPEFNKYLFNADICILPSHDKSSLVQARDAARMLFGSARSIKIFSLFRDHEMPEKDGRELSEYAEALEMLEGYDSAAMLERFNRIYNFSEEWQPEKGLGLGREGSFNFMPLSEMLQEPREEISYLWENTLPSGGFSICSAKPKVGKSTLARNLASSVISGEPFLGRNCTKGRVLYLCLEEKRSEVIGHFRAMRTGDENLLVHFGPAPQNPISEIAIAITKYEPALLIIDPLARVLRVADFNDYGSMARALESFIDLARKSNCHILALHHDGKLQRGGDALLGSTALLGSVDCHLQMKKIENRRSISSIQRYGEDMPETLISLDKETGTIRSEGEVGNTTLCRIKKELIEFMQADEAKEKTGINRAFSNYPYTIISKALFELIEDGKLIRNGSGKKGDPFLYRRTF